MTQQTPKDSPALEGASRRTRISCPGCGRNDHVTWPQDQEAFHWKCFNCRKEFDLHRAAGH